MANIKQLAEIPERLTGGHRLCSGCGASIVARHVLMGTKDPVVVGAATGCLEVATTIYPYTAWDVPYIHNAFENVAATISGAETAYRSLKKQGKVPEDKDIKFVAFGGDGGTYDIGLQSLSGALERGHNFLYVCYTNEAYMNTGIQRSGATPKGASTTTAPAGKESFGKPQRRKNLTEIIAAHEIPYVAQSNITPWNNLISCAEKAFKKNGPAFINTFALCQRGWRYKQEEGVKIAKLAADTCYWPSYEVDEGEYHLLYKPKKKLPIDEFLKTQGRFKHLFKPGNEEVLEEIQKEIDENWKKILNKCESS